MANSNPLYKQFYPTLSTLVEDNRFGLRTFDLESYLLSYKDIALKELNRARFNDDLIPTYRSDMLNLEVGEFIRSDYIYDEYNWNFRSDNTISIWKPKNHLSGFTSLSGLTQDLSEFYDYNMIYSFYTSCMLENVDPDWVHRFSFLIGTPRYFQREILSQDIDKIDLFKLTYGMQTFRPLPVLFPYINDSIVNNIVYKSLYDVYKLQWTPCALSIFRRLLCTMDRRNLIRFVRCDSPLVFKPKYSCIYYRMPQGIIYVNKNSFNFREEDGSFDLEDPNYDIVSVDRDIYDAYNVVTPQESLSSSLNTSRSNSVSSSQADADYQWLIDNLVQRALPQSGIFTPSQCSEGENVTRSDNCSTFLNDLIRKNKSYFSRIARMSPRKLKNLINKTEAQLLDINASLDIPSLRAWIDGLVQDLSAKVDNFCSDFRMILTALVVTIVAIFAVLFTQYAGSKAALGLAMLLLGLYLAPEVLNKVHDLLENYVISLERVVAHAGEATTQLSLIASMFAYCVFRTPSVKNLDTLMKTVGNLPRFCQGLEAISNFLGKGFDLAKVYFYKYILRTEMPPEATSPLVAWINRSETLYFDNIKGEFTFDEINFNVISSLYSEGLKFLHSPLYRSEISVITKMLTVLNSIISEFKNKGFTHAAARNHPVAIYLSGDTGCGKSTLTYPLSADVISRISSGSSVDLAKDWKRLIYTRNSEQEFWDGYDNQLVCVFDDFCQRRDNAMNPNIELFEIIRSVNLFPYPLHMAELSQKQNTYFTSKVILCSSNIPLSDLKTESLNYPDAVKRRFDINVKVSLKPEVNREELWRSESFDPDIYIFTEYGVDGSFKGELSYEDLVTKISNLYQRRHTLVSSMESYILSKFGKRDQKPEAQMFSWLWPLRKVQPMNFGESEPKPYYLDMWTSVMESRIQLESRWSNTYRRLVSNYPILKVVGVASMFIGIVCAGIGIFYAFRSEKPKNIITIESCERISTRPTIKCESCERVSARPTIKCESCERVSARPTIKCESCERVSVRPTIKCESCERVVSRPNVKCECVSEEVPEISIDGKPIDAVLGTAQGVLDVNASEILGKVLKKNLYAIYCGDSRVGHGIFVKGNVMLYPTHFNAHFRVEMKKDPNTIITLKAPFVNRPAWEIYAKDLLSRCKTFRSVTGETSDISMTSVIEAWAHSDITPLFVTKSSVSHVIGSAAVMPCMYTKNINDLPFGILRYTEINSRLKSTPVSYESPDGTTIMLRQSWEYCMDTIKGDCGAPLIIRNPFAIGKIVGMHVAGCGDGRGFSIPLTREFIEKCLTEFQPEDLTTLNLDNVEYVTPQSAAIDLQPDGSIPHERENIPFPGEFELLGTCKPVPAPRVSQIVKSLCYGEVQEPKTRPALLTERKEPDGTIWNPMHERMRKYGRKLTAIPHEDVLVAQKAITNDLIALIKRRNIDLNNFKSSYDFVTAMKGIDGDETINSIKRKSSPGYPWVFKTKSVGKRDFFGEDGEFLFESPLCKELQKEVDLIISKAKKGEAHVHIFTDLLKDERKPKEKSHKTRAFSGCPLQYLAVCKMYFQGVISILTKLKNESHISVGTNVYSNDWDFMTRLLTSKSDGFVAGDFEGFDSSQLVPILRSVGQVLNAICRLFPDWKEEDDLVRNILLQSLWHSVHANGSNLVRWSHALPSGHYLTAPFNSLYALTLFVMAFVKLSRDNGSRLGPSTLATTFLKEFGFVAYGDDHVCAVPKKYQDYFNQVTLEKVFKHYGIGYTTEDKRDIVEPIRPLEDVTYLKRSFRLEKKRQRWIAPLTLDTVLETPMWIHRSDDPKQATISNCEFALRELSLHSEEVWNEHAPKLHEIITRLGDTTIFVDYEETQEFVLNSELSDL